MHWKKYAVTLAAFFCGSGLLCRIFTLEMVDMRFKQLYYAELTWKPLLAGTALMALLIRQLYRRLEKASSRRDNAWLFARTQAPLLMLLPCWWYAPDFPVLLLMLAVMAWTVGFTGSFGAGSLRITDHTMWAVIAAAATISGIAGGMLQADALHKMAMQWLDWGHFYEALNNTLGGKFFHLNLSGGCYLGSRFCISLLALLPVVYFRNVELFLITGALLVTSGSYFVTGFARKKGFSPGESMLSGIWFLLLPLNVNMLLVLLDGFHESFLLYPAVLGAWYFYRQKKYYAAAAMVLFSFGVRESIGFMWLGYGVVLLLQKQYRAGTILAVVSLLYLVLMLGVVMPALSGTGSYEHTVFFPHLGNSITEIALSPVTKWRVFWGELFKSGNWYFWFSLLLPFAFAVWRKPLLLLPLLPDLLMVSLDVRIDSQNIMRHYAIVPILVLVIAALESLVQLRNEKKKVFRCALAAMVTAGVAGCWCFTQIPGLPAADKRFREWSYAGSMMEEIFKVLPEKVKVTAGPRPASMLVNRNDVFIYQGEDEATHPLQDYVLLEGFMSFFHEDKLRRKLLCTPGWELLYSGYLDERIVQLFHRRTGIPAQKNLPPPVIRYISSADWQHFGAPVPSKLPQLEMKGRITPQGTLLIGARPVQIPMDCDIAFNVEITFAGGRTMGYYTSFGNGIYPAYLAKKDEVFLMEIALPAAPEKCRVELVEIK